jgi:hypothetical protein
MAGTDVIWLPSGLNPRSMPEFRLSKMERYHLPNSAIIHPIDEFV